MFGRLVEILAACAPKLFEGSQIKVPDDSEAVTFVVVAVVVAAVAVSSYCVRPLVCDIAVSSNACFCLASIKPTRNATKNKVANARSQTTGPMNEFKNHQDRLTGWKTRGTHMSFESFITYPDRQRK